MDYIKNLKKSTANDAEKAISTSDNCTRDVTDARDFIECQQFIKDVEIHKDETNESSLSSEEMLPTCKVQNENQLTIVNLKEIMI